MVCGDWRLDTAGSLLAKHVTLTVLQPAGQACPALPVLAYKPNSVKDNKDRCCRLDRGGG